MDDRKLPEGAEGFIYQGTAMSQVLSPLDEQALQERLRVRAPEMRSILETQIPRYLRSQVSPEDILQDVWISAFRTRPVFRAQRVDSLDRWLTSIVNRALIDRLRKAYCQRRGGRHLTLRAGGMNVSSLANLFSLVASPEKTPSSEAATLEAVDAVQDALAALPDPQRRAIMLKYIEGYSRHDIAQVMQKTEAAVNSLLFNGLRRLKDKLGSGTKFFSDVST